MAICWYAFCPIEYGPMKYHTTHAMEYHLICKTSLPSHADLPFFISEGVGTWSEWGRWSECDPSWSGGNKFRSRNCNNAPSAAACDGDPTETAPCTNATSIDFFDQVFTNHKKNVTVYCCHTNNTIELATCGLGVSCAGNCSALGATLCPSGNCTGDCAYSFEEEETINTEAESGLSVATQPSWAFKWCSARCNVWKTKGCCYNPVCRDKTSAHKKRCSWFNYLTGNVW